MKKVYSQPSVEIVDIELGAMMISTSTSNQVPVDPEEKDNFNANEHRGAWGNLWE